ncbi:hypothetical protein EJ110_NYTH44173 [Nymphaea thermarum]|nr:hypothetical protein EJ110_NYTH44173 [Nymphaea thermarum]
MSRVAMSLSVHHAHVHGGAAASAKNGFKKLPRTPCLSLWEISFTSSSPEPCLKSARSRLLHRPGPAICRAVGNQDGSLIGSDGGDDDDDGQPSSKDGMNDNVSSNFVRENLEKILGNDDLNFTGMDLATLIRKKYGRSYDVQLIKKEFMGRNLLAMNVMWKFMEQRSFPLTEEEYLLRLDDVANTLKCWGAVSHVRNSLARMKDRPRIGKAVSIFIDMDESGGRSKEWIYK